jgi:N-hydroxyarylamine O-acetyltransferase
MYTKLSKKEMIINNYFKKIECDLLTIEKFTSQESLDYLQKIFSAHIQAYPFHNFSLREASQKHPVFRPPLVFFNIEEFTNGYNGGFCFQSTGVLFQALQSAGFNVYCSIAKILNGLLPDSSEAKLIPATHLVLIVTIDNNKYLLDPSAGMNGHASPFLLSDSESIYEQNSFFKIKKTPNEYLLYRKVQDSWRLSLSSSFLPSDKKLIATQLTKLKCYPITLGIRDSIILVGIATPTGGKTLLYDPKTKSFTFKIICKENGDREDSFKDFDFAYQLILNDFKIEHVSKLQFKKYCSHNCWPKSNRSNDINFPIDSHEIEKIKSNFYF